MKKLLLSLCALLALSAMAENIPASDARITYVGRTLVRDGNVEFNFSATYARISFTGNYLALRASGNKNYYNVWLDHPISANPDFRLLIESEDTTVVLFDEKSKKKEHTVIIQRRTEGNTGVTTFHEFIAKGNFLPAAKLAERQIEFVGDSYTCGYGSENSVSHDPFTLETENCAKTYAAIIARYFGADYWTICHSGWGICRNYASKFPDWQMPDIYTQTLDFGKDTIRWEASKSPLRPAMTVIYLGTNDFSTSLRPRYDKFAQRYLDLLRRIKANYGEDYPILCVSSKTDDLMFDYVRRAAEDARMKNVLFTGFFPGVHHDNDQNLGASYHPNYRGHQKLAYALIPYIATMTGWEMQEDLIK